MFVLSPGRAPVIKEPTQSVSRPDVVKSNLNQALSVLSLVSRFVYFTRASLIAFLYFSFIPHVFCWLFCVRSSCLLWSLCLIDWKNSSPKWHDGDIKLYSLSLSLSLSHLCLYHVFHKVSSIFFFYNFKPLEPMLAHTHEHTHTILKIITSKSMHPTSRWFCCCITRV